MWLRHPLNDVLSSGAKTAVLRVLCSVSAPLSVAEIARRAGVARGHASRVLASLAAAGVLLRRDHGRVATYEVVRREAPLVIRLRELFDCEAQRREAVVECLAQNVPGIVSVILFGSEARDEATSGSDTDLLIVVARKSAATETKVQETCRQLAAEHLLALSWLLADTRELRQWAKERTRFWREVRADGVTLWGKSLERLERAWKRGKAA